MSKSRKDLEQRAAVVPGELRVGQSLLSERETSEVFQEARWRSWGLDLTSQALQTNANRNPACEHGRALLILGGIGSSEGWLLPDFHHRCSAW